MSVQPSQNAPAHSTLSVFRKVARLPTRELVNSFIVSRSVRLLGCVSNGSLSK